MAGTTSVGQGKVRMGPTGTSTPSLEGSDSRAHAGGRYWRPEPHRAPQVPTWRVRSPLLRLIEARRKPLGVSSIATYLWGCVGGFIAFLLIFVLPEFEHLARTGTVRVHNADHADEA